MAFEAPDFSPKTDPGNRRSTISSELDIFSTFPYAHDFEKVYVEKVYPQSNALANGVDTLVFDVNPSIGK